VTVRARATDTRASAAHAAISPTDGRVSFDGCPVAHYKGICRDSRCTCKPNRCLRQPCSTICLADNCTCKPDRCLRQPCSTICLADNCTCEPDRCLRQPCNTICLADNCTCELDRCLRQPCNTICLADNCTCELDRCLRQRDRGCTRSRAHTNWATRPAGPSDRMTGDGNRPARDHLRLVATLRVHEHRGPSPCAHESQPSFWADMIPTAVST
jgi:hypothetical protein